MCVQVGSVDCYDSSESDSKYGDGRGGHGIDTSVGHVQPYQRLGVLREF